MKVESLNNRKYALNARLEAHGIPAFEQMAPEMLDFDPAQFATPQEAGVRMLILFCVSHAVQFPEYKKPLFEWLRIEELEKQISPREQAFFHDEIEDEFSLIDFSWEFESAYILAWALDLVPLPPVDSPLPDDLILKFIKAIPSFGQPTEDYMKRLKFRDLAEVYDENLFHEAATAEMRDRYLNGDERPVGVEKQSSFKKHAALNWLRRLSGITEWDDTDMST